MKPEKINQLYSEQQSIDRQLEEISHEWQLLEEKWHSVLTDWEQRVIAVGKAIIESKAEHGKGWKRDFPSLGFEFSYVVALRYVACAEYPNARGDANSVEAWAKVAGYCKREADAAESAKEAERKKRAEARKLEETRSSGNLATSGKQFTDKVSTSTERHHSHLKCSVDNCCLQDQMQESFDLLHDAIVADPRLKQLRPYWQRFLEGLEHGLIPRIRAVSFDESDETAEAGGADIPIDREAELLNA